MQNIKKIYDICAEEAFNNAVECSVECNVKIEETTPIYLQKWDSSEPLFSFIYHDEDSSEIKEESLKLKFEKSLDIRPIEPPSFNYLYWLEPSENRYVFKYVQCGTVTPLSNLDIAFDDSTKIALNIADPGTLKQVLTSNYVFDAGKYKLLFVNAWKNGGQNWNIYGFRQKNGKDVPRFIDVVLQNTEDNRNVRVVKKEIYSKVCFPTHFDEIEILAYSEIGFVDIGTAREAHVALIDKAHKGETLMSLWTEYSKIELDIAREESDELGKIEYSFYQRPKNGIAYLKLNVNHDQSIMLKRLADTNAQFHIMNDSGAGPIVSLLSFNMNENEATFEDELYKLPPKGKIKLSLLGNEIVDKRRRTALKLLSRGANIVMQNLLFAIEDEADKMLEDRHKPIPPMTNKTRTFLKEKFGIDSLTENQLEAVKIALNNRKDVTIIQGPPGTGKTTVVAAICHRLVELNGDNNNESVKTILASAFQNDTIEHLASKIYTHELPTVKIGKRHMGARAENIFINDMEKHLNEEINLRGGENYPSVSSKFRETMYRFITEKDVESALLEIDEILPEDTIIPGVDSDSLHEVTSSMRSFNRKNERSLSLIDSIPTSSEVYNFENGWSIIADVLQSDFEFTDEDRMFLEEAPEMNPDNDFMERLSSIKEALKLHYQRQKNEADKSYKDEIVLWLENAVKASKAFEETNYESEDDFIRSVLCDLKKDLRVNPNYIRHSLQEYGETVAATNQLAGSIEMKDFTHIKNVILEEAARSNPLDLLIPMVKAEDRIIMVGDQNQLPHLLENEVAERSLALIQDIDEKKEKRRMYEQSLFGIVFDNLEKGNRTRTITLNEQFRMHPTIGDFISNTYYRDKKTGKGILRAGTESLYYTKQHHLSLPWAKDKTMVFCDVSSQYTEGKGQSKFRKAEAERVMSIIDELRTDPAFNDLSVGVITFYSRQVTTLFEEAAKPEHGYAIKEKDGYDIHKDYRTLSNEQEKLRIGSVDSFQGKEFDVVILSTVRSNGYKREEGNEKKVFGFLTLKNRLNVAFSRAKKLVIVVGDSSMFEDDYAKQHVPGLYEYCTNITVNTSYGNRI